MAKKVAPKQYFWLLALLNLFAEGFFEFTKIVQDAEKWKDFRKSENKGFLATFYIFK